MEVENPGSLISKMEPLESDVAVLKSKVNTAEQVFEKLDHAIEKITEVNNNVTRMLAVHEERISKQEEIDSILFDKIDKLRDKMDSDHDIVAERLRTIERKLWSSVGILGAVVVSLNPTTLQKLLPLFNLQSSAIVTPARSIDNGSR